MKNFVSRLISISFLIVSCLVILPLASAVRAEEKIVLKVWDNYRREADSIIIELAIEEFKEKHPNVEFNRIVRPLEDLKMQVMAALPKGKGPDVLTVNNGENMMGPLVRGGHLLPLDRYAQKYGWEDKILSPIVLDRARYTADGSVLGKGNLYAIPFMAELVGVYYNKEIFAELGIDVPESIRDFEAACEKIKAAGYYPISFGGLDDWQFFHLYAEVQGSVLSHYMGADMAQQYLDDIVLRWQGNRTFVNKSNKEAAAILQDWVQKGYFVKGFSGMKGDDALPIFTAGKAAMFIQGSWYAGDITLSKIKAGFFPFPPYEKGEGIPPQVGGMLVPYGISKYSEHPDLAAEFIDTVISSGKTEGLLIKSNSLPARVPVSLEGLDEDSTKYDLYKTWNKVNESGRLAHYLDWISPDMWDTLGEAGRKLMNLNITPEIFVEMIEENYRNWQKEKPTAK